MDSLGHLAEQLPSHQQQQQHQQRRSAIEQRQQAQAEAEAELQVAFKASAQSLVTLLKAAQTTSKRGVWYSLLPCRALTPAHLVHRPSLLTRCNPLLSLSLAFLTDLLTTTAYQAGYSTALQDVLEYLQQGLDIHQGRPSAGFAEVIDYIEVRAAGWLSFVVALLQGSR